MTFYICNINTIAAKKIITNESKKAYKSYLLLLAAFWFFRADKTLARSEEMLILSRLMPEKAPFCGAGGTSWLFPCFSEAVKLLEDPVGERKGGVLLGDKLPPVFKLCE